MKEEIQKYIWLGLYILSAFLCIILTHLILCRSRQERGNRKTLSIQNLITFGEIITISLFYLIITLCDWTQFKYSLSMSTISMSLILCIEILTLFIRYWQVYSAGFDHVGNISQCLYRLVIKRPFWILMTVCKCIFFP